jgi:cytochrome oxidase Cu insertion factor (SCO1/SenC/PrrC family)
MKGLLRAVFLFALALFASPLDAQEDFPLPPPQITSAVGIRAPEFRLPDQSSQIVSLASFRGSKVLLMFYRGYW